MVSRSKLESRLEDIKQIKQLTDQKISDQIRKMSPVIEEFKSLLRHPRAMGTFLDEKSPWLSRQFLGVASNLTEPFTAGMGLKIEKLSEDVAEVVLPGWWRNQAQGGALHVSALTTLGEYTSRVFWDHHLDVRYSELQMTQIQLRLLSRATGDVRAAYHLTVSEREAILHRLRSSEQVELMTPVSIYEKTGRLVAEVEVQWLMRRQLALDHSRV